MIGTVARCLFLTGCVWSATCGRKEQSQQPSSERSINSPEGRQEEKLRCRNLKEKLEDKVQTFEDDDRITMEIHFQEGANVNAWRQHWKKYVKTKEAEYFVTEGNESPHMFKLHRMTRSDAKYMINLIGNSDALPVYEGSQKWADISDIDVEVYEDPRNGPFTVYFKLFKKSSDLDALRRYVEEKCDVGVLHGRYSSKWALSASFSDDAAALECVKRVVSSELKEMLIDIVLRPFGPDADFKELPVATQKAASTPFGPDVGLTELPNAAESKASTPSVGQQGEQAS